MNARQSRFVFSLLLTTGAALAQGDARLAAQSDLDRPSAKVAPVLEPVPAKGKFAWVANEPLDMVIVLASWKKLTVQVTDAQILADATILAVAPALETRQQISADLPAKYAADADLYVQAVGVKTRPALSLVAGPVQKVQIKAVADPYDGTSSDAPPAWSEDEQEALFASNLQTFYVSHLIWDLKEGTWGLYAEFRSPTTGYSLRPAGTKFVNGRLQVMLEMRIPGPGEITADMIEMHQLVLGLGSAGKTMDVYVGITDGIRHTAFRPYGSFGPE